MRIFQVKKNINLANKYNIAISYKRGWLFYVKRTKQFEERGAFIFVPPDDVIIFEDEQ